MGSQTKIMVIEDDALMSSLLEILLGLEGYSVVKIGKEESLDDVLTALRQENPALVLMDVHMKNWDGFELLSRLRRHDEFDFIRVLMSSGADYDQRSRESGADGFIMKPYMPEELVGKINEVLGA